MLTILEIGTYTELEIGTNKGKTIWPFSPKQHML